MEKVIEKRKHKRVGVPPLLVKLSSLKINELVPGIILNISAGGLAVLAYESYPLNRIFLISFELPQLCLGTVKAKVVRTEKKMGSFLLGLEFINLDHAVQAKIEKMAEDFQNCEANWLKDSQNLCSPSCSYYSFCLKKQELIR